MSALPNQTAAVLAREFRRGNPMRFGVPHTSANTVANAIRDWRMPDHHEISMVICVLASKIKDNGHMTEAAKASVVAQLDELADEVDQDHANQQAGGA